MKSVVLVAIGLLLLGCQSNYDYASTVDEMRLERERQEARQKEEERKEVEFQRDLAAADSWNDFYDICSRYRKRIYDKDIAARIRTWYLGSHRTSPNVHRAIAAGSYCLGMTEDELFASIGPTTDKNRTVGTWGEIVQYVYKRGYTYKFFYFENGKLTSWQD